MFTEKQHSELLEHLQKAQNPLFLYDNDADGLCSFVLLRRFLGRGKGAAVRTHPEIDVKYAHKAIELEADYVFVLDKPFLGQDFLEMLDEAQIPVVWIDHHDVSHPSYSSSTLSIYKGDIPVTALVYSLTGRNQDSWIAFMGCIADHYLPPFTKQVRASFSDLSGEPREPFEAYYSTELGRLARALGFGLKDSITHLNYLHTFLTECNSPYQMLEELEGSSSFAIKYREIEKKYTLLLNRALEHVSDRVIFFKYSGNLSISSDLANELCYRYPGKYVMVSYVKGVTANVSLRGSHVRDYLEKLLPMFTRANGGGHLDAVGARLQTADLEIFRNKFEEMVTRA